MRGFVSRRRRSLIAGVLCSAAGMTALYRLTAPSASVFPAVCDCGAAIQGDVSTCHFRLMNTGWRTLRILKSDTPCACVSVISPSRQVKSGAFADIEVSVYTRGVSAGRLSKDLVISTNDPAHPELMLSIRGEVRAELTFSEWSIDFGRVTVGTESRRQLAVTSLPGVEMTRVYSTVASIKTEIIRCKSGCCIVAVLAHDAPEGTNRGNIVVETNSVRTPLLRIPLLAVVTPGSRTSANQRGGPLR